MTEGPLYSRRSHGHPIRCCQKGPFCQHGRIDGMKAAYSVCKIIAEGCHSARIRKITEYSSHKTAFRVCGRRPFCQHDSMAEFRRNLGKLLAEARIFRQVTEGFFVPLPVYVRFVCRLVTSTSLPALPNSMLELYMQAFCCPPYGQPNDQRVGRPGYLYGLT